MIKSILRLFRLGGQKYPKINYEIRGEGISYSLPDKRIFIATTYIDGERIYTDSIDKWETKDKLTLEEKSQVFADTVSFMGKSRLKKIIVVINSDFDKEFWEKECERLKEKIKSIEYTTEKEKDEFLYKMFSDSIPKLTIDGQKIESKSDLDKYWLTREKKR